jgi:hypothetical protein
MSSTLVVTTTGPAVSTPQGARHRRFQLQWWPLLDMPAAPPRGSAIDISNFGGGQCRTCRHPQGPAMDIFNFGGGRCRTC